MISETLRHRPDWASSNARSIADPMVHIATMKGQLKRRSAFHPLQTFGRCRRRFGTGQGDPDERPGEGSSA